MKTRIKIIEKNNGGEIFIPQILTEYWYEGFLWRIIFFWFKLKISELLNTWTAINYDANEVEREEEAFCKTEIEAVDIINKYIFNYDKRKEMELAKEKSRIADKTKKIKYIYV